MTADRVFQDYVDDRADALRGRRPQRHEARARVAAAGPNPDHADLELHFFNGLHVAAILAEISGRRRRAPARSSASAAARACVAGNCHRPGAGDGGRRHRRRRGSSLRVEPVGDYSTYTLELVWDASRIDPFFSSIGFKFRPGCFTNDCAPALPGRPPAPGPAIDYLAKDYDSFRHTLMAAMAERVPGWQSTSEADHDQVLIDLFAAAADELSDYQDRVMNEAYLATARKRVSLARHARLVDYHLHEGNQASTWLALEIVPAVRRRSRSTDQELVVWTGADRAADEAVFFASREHRLPAGAAAAASTRCSTGCACTPGATPSRRCAPAAPAPTSCPSCRPGGAGRGRCAARPGAQRPAARELLIAERLNPLTGGVRRAQPAQAPAAAAAARRDRIARRAIYDPVTSTWLVRVHWRDEDALRFDYSFTTFCHGTPPIRSKTSRCSTATSCRCTRAGRWTVDFHEPGTILPTDTDDDQASPLRAARPLR